MVPEWLKLIGAALGGAGGFGILNYAIGRKELDQQAEKTANEEFRLLLEIYKEDFSAYKEESKRQIQELNQAVKELQKAAIKPLPDTVVENKSTDSPLQRVIKNNLKIGK